MKQILTNLPIGDIPMNGHDCAQAYDRLQQEGWEIIKVYEDHGKQWVVVQKSK